MYCPTYLFVDLVFWWHMLIKESAAAVFVINANYSILCCFALWPCGVIHDSTRLCTTGPYSVVPWPNVILFRLLVLVVPEFGNNTVWYNDECKNARKERKKALNLIKRQPTRSNLEHYRIIQAKTRRIMKSTKCQSWQSFVSKINNRTPQKKVWSMIRKISAQSWSYRCVRHSQRSGWDFLWQLFLGSL